MRTADWIGAEFGTDRLEDGPARARPASPASKGGGEALGHSIVDMPGADSLSYGKFRSARFTCRKLRTRMASESLAGGYLQVLLSSLREHRIPPYMWHRMPPFESTVQARILRFSCRSLPEVSSLVLVTGF